jgi:hypothetical protein
MKASKPKATKTGTNQGMTSHTSPDLQARIARRAYELFEQRGREHGHDREDWLRAEQDILDQQ